MTGRGSARGRSRGVADPVLTTPGGLASNHEEHDAGQGDDCDEQATKPSGTGVQDDSEILTVADGNSGRPTLSLSDIKSILENTRTYSEQNDVKRVLFCARNFVRTEDDVKTLASLIYNKCLEDASLAKRGAEICDGLTSIEVGNTKFRNCLLSLVQASYKEKNELFLKDSTRFNGFLAFLCEIFGIMRTVSNEVFKPLINPIFDCLNLVLGPQAASEGDSDDTGRGDSDFILNEDVCENFSSQLTAVGKLLEEHSEDQMRQLMNRVRTCIIHSKSSARVRCCLLEVVECYARGWAAADNDTTMFYCDMSVGIISGLVL